MSIKVYTCMCNVMLWGTTPACTQPYCMYGHPLHAVNSFPHILRSISHQTAWLYIATRGSVKSTCVEVLSAVLCHVVYTGANVLFRCAFVSCSCDQLSHLSVNWTCMLCDLWTCLPSCLQLHHTKHAITHSTTAFNTESSTMQGTPYCLSLCMC